MVVSDADVCMCAEERPTEGGDGDGLDVERPKKRSNSLYVPAINAINLEWERDSSS